VSRSRSLLRAEYVLPIAVLLAAACVAAAEFSTLFEFRRGTSGELLKTTAAADRHYYALLVLAVFAVVALAVAVFTGSRPAAFAVAAAGGLSLLIFLLVDLPDVNVEGPLDDPYFFTSKAEPATGFWLELIGTVALAVTGGALATLRSDQLRMIVPARYRREAEPAAAERPRRSTEPALKRPRAQSAGEQAEASELTDRDDGAQPKRRASRAAARRRAG
jgi:hypothetical protein